MPVFNLQGNSNEEIQVTSKLVFLDGKAKVNGIGTKLSPFNDLDTAIAAAGPGGVIALMSTVTLQNTAVFASPCLICKAPGFVDEEMFTIDTGGVVTFEQGTISGGFLDEAGDDSDDEGDDSEWL